MNSILEKIEKAEAELAKKIYVSDGMIVINTAYEYQISILGCNTHEKILWWVHHLTEKGWITTEILREFIEIACRENSINL